MDIEEAKEIRQKIADYLKTFDTSKLNSSAKEYVEVNYRGWHVFVGKDLIGIDEWSLAEREPTVMVKNGESFLGGKEVLYEYTTEKLVDDWPVIKASLNEVYNKCLRRANFEV